jgi:hypothetical protein
MDIGTVGWLGPFLEHEKSIAKLVEKREILADGGEDYGLPQAVEAMISRLFCGEVLPPRRGTRGPAAERHAPLRPVRRADRRRRRWLAHVQRVTL